MAPAPNPPSAPADKRRRQPHTEESGFSTQISLNELALDRSLMSLIEVPWKNRHPMDKVAGALAYLWSQREPRSSLEYLELLAKRYVYPGGKIEHYFRSVRDVGTGTQRR